MSEQSNTLYDLNDRIKPINEEPKNNILIYFDAHKLNKERAGFLQRLSEIINSSGEVGEMEYDIFKLNIKSLSTGEYDFIKNK